MLLSNCYYNSIFFLFLLCKPETCSRKFPRLLKQVLRVCGVGMEIGVAILQSLLMAAIPSMEWSYWTMAKENRFHSMSKTPTHLSQILQWKDRVSWTAGALTCVQSVRKCLERILKLKKTNSMMNEDLQINASMNIYCHQPDLFSFQTVNLSKGNS